MVVLLKPSLTCLPFLGPSLSFTWSSKFPSGAFVMFPLAQFATKDSFWHFSDLNLGDIPDPAQVTEDGLDAGEIGSFQVINLVLQF